MTGKKVVYVDTELHKQIKKLAVEHEVTLTSLVEEGIRMILKVAT